MPFFPSPERAAQALEVMTLLVSVRRSLFGTDLDRRRFLMLIMSGVCDILRGKEVGAASHCACARVYVCACLCARLRAI